MKFGLIKMKGDAYTISPERFEQIPVECAQPIELLKREMLGYVGSGGWHWIICSLGEGKYCRVPFARNRLWFQALTSEFEFKCIGALPQIFVTGLA